MLINYSMIDKYEKRKKQVIMKHISLLKQSLLLAAAAFTALFTGCINEDLAECSKLTIQVQNAAGEDITNLGMVEDATLYFFDTNNNLIEKRIVDKNFILNHTVVDLSNYKDNTKLHIVAWANLKSDNQTVADPKSLNELSLSLKSANGYAVSPDSLYYGNKDVTSLGSGITGGDGYIPVKIKTGSLSIKTSGLSDAVRFYGLKSATDFNYYMTRTLNAYDYAGIQTGDSVTYNPAGEYDSSQEWETQGVQDQYSKGGKQNVFAGTNLGVTLKSTTGSLNAQVTEALNVETGKMEPLMVNEGGRLDVLIEFGVDGTISAKMRITPWGVVDDGIVF